MASQLLVHSARARTSVGSGAGGEPLVQPAPPLAEVVAGDPVVEQVGRDPQAAGGLLRLGEAVLQGGAQIGVLQLEPGEPRHLGRAEQRGARVGRQLPVVVAVPPQPRRAPPRRRRAVPGRTGAACPASGSAPWCRAPPGAAPTCPPARSPGPGRPRGRCRRPSRPPRPPPGPGCRRTPRPGPTAAAPARCTGRSSSRSAPAASGGGAAPPASRWSAAGTGRPAGPAAAGRTAPAAARPPARSRAECRPAAGRSAPRRPGWPR